MGDSTNDKEYEYLTEQCGGGFSVVNLQSIRKFYLAYSAQIQQTLSAKSEKQQTLTAKSEKRYSPISVFDEEVQKGQVVESPQQKLAEWIEENESHGGDSA